jgi:hypothetical protein
MEPLKNLQNSARKYHKKPKILTSNQAWPNLRYMGAMIYLNMKKLHARTENL